MFDFLRHYQLNIMMIFSGICGTLAVLALLTKSLSKRRRFAIMCIELGSMLLLIFDRYAYIYRGDISQIGYYMVRISNFLVFLFTIFISYSFNLYIKDLCMNEVGRKKTPKTLLISNLILLFAFFLLILSRVFGFYYKFDKTNHYYRSDGFYLCFSLPMIAMILTISLVIRERKKIRKAILISLLMFTLVPLACAVIQIFAYGLSLVNIAYVGMAMALYIFALLDMNSAVEHARNLEIQFLKDEQRNAQLIFEQTAQALSFAIDAKDRYTHGHSLRVAEYSRKIARATGIPEKECDEIYYTGLLHDVGKIGIKDYIINKDGRLTEEEFAKIKAHPTIGKNILSSINKLPYLSIGANYHHERYDGKGYPSGLKGEDIPYIARIIAVADAYDAMTSKRSYRDPLPQQKVREELVKGIGTQFDPIYAREMVHMIDLDDEYNMKEREDASELEGKNIVFCNEYRSDTSEGILITRSPINIRVRCLADEDSSSQPSSCIPALILFDSLDARIHDKSDNIAKEMVYFEYAEIDTSGHATCHGARNIRITDLPKDSKRFSSEKATRPGSSTYDIEAVKYEDHVRLKVYGSEKSFETIIALPDSARYAYLAFTGTYCTINIESISRSETPIAENEIPRIAEVISYINVPEGDIPNVQVNGWCSAYSQSIPIKKELLITFHAMSLPTARLVWHCPYISLFTSDDGMVKGKNYREFCLMRLDGESWITDDYVKTNPLSNKLDGFEDWDTWKAKNREGFDCEIRVQRSGNTIVLHTCDNDIDLKNTISILDENIKDLYIALSGDQVALTNINIK